MKKKKGGSVFAIWDFRLSFLLAHFSKKVARMNDENLKPCTKENARERQLKSAEKRKENNAKKKLMSQIYAEFLEREYNVRQGDKDRKLTGAELCNEVMRKVLARSDSASVSLLREIRSCLDGENINLSGEIKTDMQTTEGRIKAFKNLMGKNE